MGNVQVRLAPDEKQVFVTDAHPGDGACSFTRVTSFRVRDETQLRTVYRDWSGPHGCLDGGWLVVGTFRDMRAWVDEAREDEAREDEARENEAREDEAWEDEAWEDEDPWDLADRPYLWDLVQREGCHVAGMCATRVVASVLAPELGVAFQRTADGVYSIPIPPDVLAGF